MKSLHLVTPVRESRTLTAALGGIGALETG